MRILRVTAEGGKSFNLSSAVTSSREVSKLNRNNIDYEEPSKADVRAIKAYETTKKRKSISLESLSDLTKETDL